MTQILGILNLTRDSFSDAGRYLDPSQALAHARRMCAEGATIIDVGAESSNPDGEDVSAPEEIARLTPVVKALKAEGVRVSVDTRKPEVMRDVLALGADFINDITALRHPDAVRALHHSDARVILMYARHSAAVEDEIVARAEQLDADPGTIVSEIVEFLRERAAALVAAGIARERMIVDPGMGYFLSRDPRVSFAVLRELARLGDVGLPVCISTSRKSFIGAALDSLAQPRPVEQRSAGTLMSEIWAVQQGAAYVRTHAPGPLRDALRVLAAIRAD